MKHVVFKNAKYFLKKSYLKAILVAFISCVIISFYRYSFGFAANHTFFYVFRDLITNSNVDKGIFGALLKTISYNGLVSDIFYTIVNVIKQGIANKFISLLAFIVVLLFHIFIQNIIKVGQKRYYLLSMHEDAKIDALLYGYKNNFINIAKLMIIKDLYTILWGFTIIYFPIKYYEYKMIPYILATNPDISKDELFKKTKELTYGHKLEIFKIDLRLIPYYILHIFTLGLSSIFYFDAYKEFIYASIYKELNHDKIEIKETKKTKVLDYDKNYSIKTYILLFFTLGILGYIWEVTFNLIQFGYFANRGAMTGPIIPIYGYGIVSILILLKPFRKKPVLFFIMTMVLCALIEYYTSVYLEHVKGMRYWDYFGYFLNINGRICLEVTILFGFAGAAATYFIAPIFDKLFSKIPNKIATVLIIFLLLCYVGDLVYTQNHPNSGPGVTTEIST